MTGEWTYDAGAILVAHVNHKKHKESLNTI